MVLSERFNTILPHNNIFLCYCRSGRQLTICLNMHYTQIAQVIHIYYLFNTNFILV